MLAHFVDSHQSYHGEWLWGPTSMILVILATCRGKLTPKVATWQQKWATWASSKRPKPSRYRKKQAVGPSGRRYSKRCCTQNFRISHHQREISVQKFRFETFDFQPCAETTPESRCNEPSRILQAWRVGVGDCFGTSCRRNGRDWIPRCLLELFSEMLTTCRRFPATWQEWSTIVQLSVVKFVRAAEITERTSEESVPWWS